jgi:uncharacterized protein YozE (UPF0346 family)
MTIDISGIAYAIRSDSAQSPHPIKLSHAQQCVAASLGHKSLASLQASGDAGQAMDRETHVLLDAQALADRRQELALRFKDEELLALVHSAFGKRLVGIAIHTSHDAFENALRDTVQSEVLNDSAVVGEMTVTNNDGIREIYLPFNVEWDSIPDNGDPVEFPFEGHVTMEIDKERPYWGHPIDVKASIWVSHPGRAIWATSCKVESAKLDRGFFDGREEEPPRVSLTEALAEELGLSFDEADQLVDAEFNELASDDGVVYGHVFDFSELDLTPRLRRKLERKDASLRATVAPYFFDRVHGREAQPGRHYVHGDQSESEPSQYYCASCDFFVPAGHFEAEHAGETEERFFASMRAWQRRPSRSKVNVRRPAAAKNLLAAGASAQQAAREASRSNFHRWLEQQAKRNDPVGDLARDVKADRRFPMAEGTRTALQAYLESSGAIPDAIRAFRAAWREFEATVPRTQAAVSSVQNRQ